MSFATFFCFYVFLHMSEEDLLAVNPEIKSPLEKDARIVVYNKI